MFGRLFRPTSSSDCNVAGRVAVVSGAPAAKATLRSEVLRATSDSSFRLFDRSSDVKLLDFSPETFSVRRCRQFVTMSAASVVWLWAQLTFKVRSAVQLFRLSVCSSAIETFDRSRPCIRLAP